MVTINSSRRERGVQKIVSTNTKMAIRFFSTVAAVFFSGVHLFGATVARSSTGGLNDGLLIEADLKSAGRSLAGRVLVEAGRESWTTVASSPATKTEPEMKFEVRANLIDSDVAQVEARIVAKDEQSTTIVVRLGDRGTISQDQMEGAGKASAPSDLKVEVKVLRVRYSL